MMNFFQYLTFSQAFLDLPQNQFFPITVINNIFITPGSESSFTQVKTKVVCHLAGRHRFPKFDGLTDRNYGTWCVRKSVECIEECRAPTSSSGILVFREQYYKTFTEFQLISLR